MPLTSCETGREVRAARRLVAGGGDAEPVAEQLQRGWCRRSPDRRRRRTPRSSSRRCRSAPSVAASPAWRPAITSATSPSPKLDRTPDGVDLGVGAQLGDDPGDERAVTAFEVERAGRVVVGFVLVVDRESCRSPAALRPARWSAPCSSRGSCAPARRVPFSTTVRNPVSSTRICGRRRPSMFSRRRRKRGSSAGSAVDSITLRMTPLSSGLVSTTLPRKAISPAHVAGAPSGLPITVWAPRKTWFNSAVIGVPRAASSRDRLLDPRERPAIFAVDRFAFDVPQPHRLERQVPCRRRARGSRAACSLS